MTEKKEKQLLKAGYERIGAPTKSFMTAGGDLMITGLGGVRRVKGPLTDEQVDTALRLRFTSFANFAAAGLTVEVA